MPYRVQLRHCGYGWVDLEENFFFRGRPKLPTILEEEEGEDPSPTTSQNRPYEKMARKNRKTAAKGEAGKPKETAKLPSSLDEKTDRGDGQPTARNPSRSDNPASSDNTKPAGAQQPAVLPAGQEGEAGPSPRQPPQERANVPSGEFNAEETAAYFRQEIFPPPMVYRSATRPLLPDGRPVSTFGDRSTVMANGRDFFDEYDKQAKKLEETGGTHEGG